jgi:hypothetical protein
MIQENSKFQLLYGMVFLSLVSVSCSKSDSSDHSSPTYQPKPESAAKAVTAPAPASGADALTSDAGLKALRQKCWVAVSGTILGIGTTNPKIEVFPKTMSGSPISYGERLDLYGGRYFGPRAAAYVLSDDKELVGGLAENYMDSIAIAPNMELQIARKDGTEIFQGAGPVIAVASLLSGSRYQYHTKIVQYLKKITDLPSWMSDYLTKGEKIKLVDTHPANANVEDIKGVYSFRVSAVKGSECDRPELMVK